MVIKVTPVQHRRLRALYKSIEFVKYEKLHLNVSFFARFAAALSARCALLLFHERDLAEMKPTDVIAPFLASIEFVSARHSFAAMRIIIVKIIFCLSVNDFSPDN